MAETQREKVQNFIRNMGKAIEAAPAMQRQGGFDPLEKADAIYRAYKKEQERKNITTPIEIRPKNFEVRTVPAQPLMGPNDKVASSIDPNTGINFPPVEDIGEEIDADNIAISQLRSSAEEPGAGAANENTASLLNGLKYGGDLAQSQKQEGLINEASDAISGLLGNVDFKGLFRVLARPEFVAPMGPGQTPVTNFINAAAADRTAQAATRALQQEAGLEGFKAETDRLKALMPDPSKMPKLTGEVNKLYDQLASSQNMANIGERIRTTLNTSMAATGGPGEAAKGFRAVAAMFGADIDVNADNLANMVASLKAEIIKGRLFGREANKQELEILNKLVVGGSFTTNKSQILNALSALTRQAEQRSFDVTNRLQAFGMRTDFTTKRKSNTGYSINPRP